MAHDLDIPDVFWTVCYDSRCYPGANGVSGPVHGCERRLPSLARGANCQLFAYELLRHNGFRIGDLRSSELWTDRQDTMPVNDDTACGDLLLFNRADRAWGAHVAVALGDGRAIHLSKQIGRPVVWTLAAFAAEARYACFIGAKRPIRRDSVPMSTAAIPLETAIAPGRLPTQPCSPFRGDFG